MEQQVRPHLKKILFLDYISLHFKDVKERDLEFELLDKFYPYAIFNAMIFVLLC